MVSTPVLDFQLMSSNQSQKHVTFNNALLEMDILIQLTILDRDLNNPPGSPSPGDRYIVASGATGLWTGQEGKIAAWINSIWKFFDPLEGWIAWVLDESILIQWDGSQWQQFTPDAVEGAPTFGINTGADTTNRLAVASPASLFTHDGSPGGHQLKINKATPADTASLLYQTGFSGRAEMGLAGSDDFAIKVSADGTLWHDGLVVDAATGAVSLPNGLSVAGQITGDAVTQSSNDTTPGRAILTEHGWTAGNLIGAVSQSGGVPTGAVIQRGSNSNGEFVRFADGTQLCQVSLGSSSSGDTQWNFPAVFGTVSPTALIIQPIGSAGDVRIGVQRGIDLDGGRFRIYDETGAQVASSSRLIAIGRWF